jgi:hypothetical protein
MMQSDVTCSENAGAAGFFSDPTTSVPVHPHAHGVPRFSEYARSIYSPISINLHQSVSGGMPPADISARTLVCIQQGDL